MANPKLQSYIRYRVTLVEAVIAGTVEITGSGASDYQIVWERSTYTTARTDMIMFIMAKRPVKGIQCDITITGLNNSSGSFASSASDEMSVPAYTSMDKGIVVLHTATVYYWQSATAVAVDSTNHGTTGEQYDLILVPKWNDNDSDGSDGFCDLHYVRGGDISAGATKAPIADRMDPNYSIIDVRPDNTFTLSANYVSNSYQNGLAWLKGRNLTFLMEIRENGGAEVVEYVYLTGAVVNTLPISMPDNGEVMNNGDGFFDRAVHYAP